MRHAASALDVPPEHNSSHAHRADSLTVQPDASVASSDVESDCYFRDRQSPHERFTQTHELLAALVVVTSNDRETDLVPDFQHLWYIINTTP